MNELEMQQMQLIIAVNDFNRDLSNLSDCSLIELTNKVEKLKKNFNEISIVINILHIKLKD